MKIAPIILATLALWAGTISATAMPNDPDNKPRGLNCPAPGSVRSLNSAQPTNIQFVNSSGRPLKIYWLDYKGQRKFYKDLNVGQSYRQKTYMTHPWIAVDGRGNCMGTVMQAAHVGDNTIQILKN